MAGQGRRGVEPQAEKRHEFARLIGAGVSISEASRQVSINRKTGMRWRHGRTITTPRGIVHHYPSVVTVSKPDISPRCLSEDERVRIADLATHGAGLREIARDIGRNPSTVSCELWRNADPDDGRCRPFAAQRMATLRRARPGRGRIANDEVLRRCGYDGLNWPHLGVLCRGGFTPSYPFVGVVEGRGPYGTSRVSRSLR